jgi:hypothetical protein
MDFKYRLSYNTKRGSKMAKITIKLDEEIYETLAKIEQHLLKLVDYFDTLEIQIINNEDTQKR